MLAMLVVALSALAHFAMAGITYDKNGEVTHCNGVPLPPIQTQSERMSQALNVCRDFFLAQQNSEWSRLLELLDGSVIKKIRDAEGLSILASPPSQAVLVDGRIAPEIFFSGKEFDVCFVSYWNYDESIGKSSYTLFVLRLGEDGRYRVMFNQPSRLTALYAGLFRKMERP